MCEGRRALIYLQNEKKVYLELKATGYCLGLPFLQGWYRFVQCLTQSLQVEILVVSNVVFQGLKDQLFIILHSVVNHNFITGNEWLGA